MDPQELKKEVEKAERSLARAKAASTLTTRKKAVLVAMCASRNIPTADATITMLADRLWTWKNYGVRIISRITLHRIVVSLTFSPDGY